MRRFLLSADSSMAEEISENLSHSFQQLSGMSFEELLSRAVGAVTSSLPRLGWTLLAFLVGCLLVRLLVRGTRRVLGRTTVDPAQHGFILTSIKILLFALLGITCVGILGVNLTPMIAALGALGLAVSLAMQDILSNIAGGISILLSRPFTKGDFVEIGDLSGTIIEIGMVYTTLKTVDNKTILLPNGDLAKATIINYSVEPVRRLDLTFHIRDGADFDRAKAVAEEIVASSPLVLKDPAPIVRFSDQSYAYVQMAVLVWVESPNLFPLKSQLIADIRKKLGDEGLSPVRK